MALLTRWRNATPVPARGVGVRPLPLPPPTRPRRYRRRPRGPTHVRSTTPTTQRAVNGTSSSRETTTGASSRGQFTATRLAGHTTHGLKIPVAATG